MAQIRSRKARIRKTYDFVNLQPNTRNRKKTLARHCEELTTREEFLRRGSNNLGAEGGDHVGYDGSNGKDVDEGLIPPTL